MKYAIFSVTGGKKRHAAVGGEVMAFESKAKARTAAKNMGRPGDRFFVEAHPSMRPSEVRKRG